MEENIVEISEKEYNELKDWQTKYLYLLAEFDNYKKRIAQRDSLRETYKYEDWFNLIIPFIDDIDRVYANENVSEGVVNVFNKFIKLCEDNGLHKMENDKFFDINKHNAVGTSHQPELSEHEITSVVNHGYMYNDKVIRYANVVVNMK